jgi:hypothetical protein
LLQIVRDDDDCMVSLEFDNCFLDFCRRYRIDGRAGFVEKQDLRMQRDGARDAEALLLPTRKADAM